MVAFCSRIEKIRIKRREGQAKTLGIIICVAGAILIAFYQGPAVISVDDDDDDMMLNRSSIVLPIKNAFDTSSFLWWQLGVLCLLGNCLTWAIWFILQVLHYFDLLQ